MGQAIEEASSVCEEQRESKKSCHQTWIDIINNSLFFLCRTQYSEHFRKKMYMKLVFKCCTTSVIWIEQCSTRFENNCKRILLNEIRDEIRRRTSFIYSINFYYYYCIIIIIYFRVLLLGDFNISDSNWNYGHPSINWHYYAKLTFEMLSPPFHFLSLRQLACNYCGNGVTLCTWPSFLNFVFSSIIPSEYG